MLSAQRLADEAVENANRRAGDIVKEAEDKASRIVDDAQEEKNTLSKELDSLRSAAGEYRKNFLELVNKHKRMLEDENGLFDADGQE